MVKRKRSMADDSMDFVKENVVMGVGAGVLEGMPVGGVTSAGIRASGLVGMQNMARYQRVKGTMIGAKHTLGMLQDMTPSTKKKKSSWF